MTSHFPRPITSHTGARKKADSCDTCNCGRTFSQGSRIRSFGKTFGATTNAMTPIKQCEGDQCDQSNPQTSCEHRRWPSIRPAVNYATLLVSRRFARSDFSSSTSRLPRETGLRRIAPCSPCALPFYLRYACACQSDSPARRSADTNAVWLAEHYTNTNTAFKCGTARVFYPRLRAQGRFTTLADHSHAHPLCAQPYGARIITIHPAHSAPSRRTISFS
jgi:hypothetical protein